MSSENETVEDIAKMMRRNEEVFYHIYWCEYADRIEAAHKREVAELRECLREAIREKCPFTRMRCKHGEPCDYECGTVKWRKALQDEGGAKCGV